MVRPILRAAERWLNCKIYRDSLPHGTDLASDVRKSVGIENVRTIFDVGAHVGLMTSYFAEQFPDAAIYSFEPVTSLYQKLKVSTASLPHVKTFNKAMGDHEGEIDIWLGKYSTMNSALKPAGDAEKITVPMVTIDSVVKSEALQSIDLLKIDVEGFELQVLKGASGLLAEKRIGFIYVESEPIETQEFFIPFAAFNEFFADMGYSLFGIYDQQTDWNGHRRLIYFNPVYVSPKLVPASVTPADYSLVR